MNKFILILTTLFFSQVIYAQEIDMKWGDRNDKDIAVITKLIGTNSKGEIYALSVKKKTLNLEIYKNNLERKSMVKIDLPDANGKQVDFEGIFMRNGQLTLFASSNVDKVNTLYAYKLSSSGKTSRRTKILDIPLEKKRRSGQIILHQEENSPNLLVGMFVPKKKEKKQVAEFKLLDENLEVITEVKKKFPYADNEDDRIYFKNAKYDEKGNVYILTYSKEKIGKIKISAYTLTQLRKDGESNKKNLGSSTKPIEKIDYSFSEDGFVNVFGFYVLKTRLKTKGIDGAYVQKLNIETFESEYKKVVEFDYKHKKPFMKDKKAKADKAMPNDFVPLYFYDNKDGGFTIIAERRLVTRTRNSKGQTTTSHLYQDVMILKINTEGRIEYIEDIDKRQLFAYTNTGIGLGFITYTSIGVPAHLNNLPYMSFMPIVKDDGTMIFIYNDNPKNVGVETEKRKVLRNMKKGLPMMAVITPDGKKKVDMIPGAKDNETIFRTTINLQTSENEYIIYGSNKRKDKLGKMTVQ